jgi:hypothetical protein
VQSSAPLLVFILCATTIFTVKKLSDYASLSLVCSNLKSDQPEPGQFVTRRAPSHYGLRCSVCYRTSLPFAIYKYRHEPVVLEESKRKGFRRQDAKRNRYRSGEFAADFLQARQTPRIFRAPSAHKDKFFGEDLTASCAQAAHKALFDHRSDLSPALHIS